MRMFWGSLSFEQYLIRKMFKTPHPGTEIGTIGYRIPFTGPDGTGGKSRYLLLTIDLKQSQAHETEFLESRSGCCNKQ